MPPFDGRLSRPQVDDLVDFVRAFAPTRRKSVQGEQERADLASFNETFLHYQEQLDELQRQYRELSEVSPGGAPPESPGSRHHEPSHQSPRGEPATPAIRALFQNRCVKCHGADGTGNEARNRIPEIPDFTNASWQAHRADAQLLAGILNGKGDDMPPWRGKISEEQARGLVAYLRAFAPTVKKSSREKLQGVTPVGFAEVKPPRGLFRMRLVSMPVFADMQGDSFKSPQHPTSRHSEPPSSGTPAIRALFQKRCVKCHGADGTGNEARNRLPEIPDFTNASWQARRDDAQLMASILDGKEDEMPPWRGKISEEQVRGLVAYVRDFARARERPGEKEKGGPDLASFDKRYHRLEQEANDLRRLYHDLPKAAPGGAPSKPSEPGQHELARRSAPEAPAPPGMAELFRQRCVKCHGADGTGNKARKRLPEIPDFTDPSWQARRADSKLVASILDGKGDDMPPARGKISAEQARGLVAYLRAFAPTMKESADEELEGIAPGAAAEDKPPRGFFEKLIRWFGKFHPPVVHFPIALLTAAAVAELLRISTDKPVFDAISRYCLWFGTITALVSGVLGWFRGGFRLTDPSWVMLTHRWLGTSTVVLALLVLVLYEVTCHLKPHRSRIWFQVPLIVLAVLVSVTGFFGGAVVYGLNHYNWPR
jgi:mono/diheme cytochrome c family protein/uncharacterized membrane protein